MTNLQDILNQMKTHGIQPPPSPVQIAVPNARHAMETCFGHFLAGAPTPFQWQPEYDHVAQWLTRNNGRGLLLYGDCGRGKSLLARYVLPAILLSSCHKVVSVYDTQQMNQQPDEVLRKHIITLDDIGTEEVSNNFGNKRLAFAEIMDAAEKHGKLIIISTNLDGRALEQRYGQRTIERIIATTTRVQFSGKSLRK